MEKASAINLNLSLEPEWFPKKENRFINYWDRDYEVFITEHFLYIESIMKQGFSPKYWQSLSSEKNKPENIAVLRNISKTFLSGVTNSYLR